MDVIIPAIIIVALAATLAYGILNCFFSSVKIDIAERIHIIDLKLKQLYEVEDRISKKLEDLEFVKELKK